MDKQQCCVLIPSLEPDEKLTAYVRKLTGAGYGLILVVDDGSSESYQPIFNEIASWDGCRVLHHEVNRGKGAALKTGFSYVLENTDLQGVITADSDGQHTVPDTLRLTELLKADEKNLLLGSRDFSRKSKAVPPKSRFGNRTTSAIFALFYGRWLPDTQTGLRGLSRPFLKEQLPIGGDRFEYEMNQLIYCAVHKLPMTVVPIETIYENENQGTHFHPIRDSWRIYKLILGSFFRFMGASLLCTLVDLLLFTLLRHWPLPQLIGGDTVWYAFGMKLMAVTVLATWIARVFSASLNYFLNRSLVFRMKDCKGSMLRYLLVAVLIMLVSSGLVSGIASLFHLSSRSFSNTLIKVVVDTVLYFINYRIQKNWVFAQREKL